MTDRGSHCKFEHPYSRRSDGKQICRVCERARVKQARGQPEKRAQLTAYMQRWRNENREHHNRVARDLQRKRAKWLSDYKTRWGCRSCGERHPACLEFHHFDPSNKEIAVSLAKRWSMKRLLAEIEKCKVLCSNCHRKLHWGHLAPKGDRDHDQ